MQEYTAQKVELVGIAGEYKNQRIPLSSKPLVLGKDPQKAHLVLSNDLISRTHCRLYLKNGQVYIEDLHSRNGTWINDEQQLRASQPTVLKSGDLVSLAGSEVFRLVAIAAPSASPAPRQEQLQPVPTQVVRPTGGEKQRGKVPAGMPPFWKSAQNLCALALMIFFFFPWAQVPFFFVNISGYTLGKIGSYGNWAWLSPAGGVGVIIVGLLGEERLQRVIGLITGAMPLVALLYGLSEIGQELFHFLAIGAYCSILAGILLIFSALGLIEIPSNK